MHAGKNFTLKEVIIWTRRDIYLLFVLSTIPTLLYMWLDCTWLVLPWLPLALMGTAVAFVIGFKNNASYDRLWEARRIWGSIVNSSRSWAIMVKDYINNQSAKEPLAEEALKEIHRRLYYRHFAWLTALRYQLREPRAWEAIYKSYNAEYKAHVFKVEEQETKMEDAVKPYLSEDEYRYVLSKSNKAAQIIALQSEDLKRLLERGLIDSYHHMELGKMLVELYNHQGGSERIKNFPYPRQYATLNLWFIKIFIFLLPFGMLQEFDKFNHNMVWLAIPFTVLSGWIFTTMEKIGEASESPFEGSANDVPITTISRTIEIDMREMLNEKNIPPPLKPYNNILV